MGKRRERVLGLPESLLPVMRESHVPGKLAVRNITHGCDKVTTIRTIHWPMQTVVSERLNESEKSNIPAEPYYL